MKRDLPRAARRLLLPALGGACVLTGCVAHVSELATDVDPATTQPSHWMVQPSAATVTSADFGMLFAACEDVARDYLFRIDRIDYRSGVLTTHPLVSGQWFEPWRLDARTQDDRMESSIATIRRTIRFEITRAGEQTWEMKPKVLVERQAIAERRITSVVLYRSVFTPARDSRGRLTGTVESDQGINLPQRYWYPQRRDEAFERAIAAAVEQRLRSSRDSSS
jgi:hypothetical protein